MSDFENDLDQYLREVEIEFEGENYRVRDNGAVYRKHRSGRRGSNVDDTWTFGTCDNSSGYMRIGAHDVHRIVAFAFHGAPPSDKYVVDHIDAVKGNNCANNLRWVTLLINTLRHPSMRKLIIDAYASLEAYFENPAATSDIDPTIAWVRTVSREEAQRTREQLEKWAESDGRPKGDNMIRRVYGMQQSGPPIPRLVRDIQSLTPMALQRNWATPCEFPCCPTALGSDPLSEYAGNASQGAVFSRNKYGESSVEMAEQGHGFLSVLTVSRQDDAMKPWAVAKVTIEKERFVHENIGSYFQLDGAKKAHFKLLGIPFSGESIDDYM